MNKCVCVNESMRNQFFFFILFWIFQVFWPAKGRSGTTVVDNQVLVKKKIYGSQHWNVCEKTYDIQ